MANHLGRVGAMAQGRRPVRCQGGSRQRRHRGHDVEAAVRGVRRGSDKGAPTRAKPEVWKDSAKVKDLAGKMQAEAEKFDAAAKTGNLDNIKTALGSLGASCKACHDDYRAEKYSSN